MTQISDISSLPALTQTGQTSALSGLQTLASGQQPQGVAQTQAFQAQLAQTIAQLLEGTSSVMGDDEDSAGGLGSASATNMMMPMQLAMALQQQTSTLNPAADGTGATSAGTPAADVSPAGGVTADV